MLKFEKWAMELDSSNRDLWRPRGPVYSEPRAEPALLMS